MNTNDILQGQLDDQTIDHLSDQIGTEQKEKTKTAAKGAIATLLSGLNNNAKKPGGINALLAAIDRDHDGNILEDIPAFLFGRRPAQNPKTTDGEGILDHILGDRKEEVKENMSKRTGLNLGQISRLLVSLAPLVMGALGRMRNQSNLDAGGFQNLLQRSLSNQEDRNLNWF
jgi:hypothetical protein